MYPSATVLNLPRPCLCTVCKSASESASNEVDDRLKQCRVYSCGHAIIMLLKVRQPTLHCRRIGQSLRDERGYPKNKKHGKNKPTLALFHSCGLRKWLCPESRPTCYC
ncbi:hypothetical protein Zmor_017730 [Zophobas morio]|uniref:Uncharacterized protein n=1 Tax=Zophobas morio TaxID=2755281 RepID=A0AA38MCG5_9CUCU|nr:hypothetical protein Zmor_017730 [Zophobas morio]